jgi:hypothetical protein
VAYPGAKVELFVGGAWVDITGDVYLEGKIRITRGRASESARVTTARAGLKIRNTAGKYTPENPLSPYYGLIGRNTKLRISVEPSPGLVSYRLTGVVSGWPQEWHPSGKKVWSPIEVNGILRRLGQGTKPLKDSLRRHIEAHGPLVYWPLTDGQEAREGTEVVTGATPMRTLGDAGSFYQGQVNWAKGAIAPWLDPVAGIPSATIGELVATVRRKDVTAWSLDVVRSGTDSSSAVDIFDTGQRTDSNPLVKWSINMQGLNSNEIMVSTTAYYDDTSSFSFLTTLTNAGINDLGHHHIRLSVADDGAGGTDWALYVDGASKASGNHVNPTRPISKVRYEWSLQDAEGRDTGPLSVGHITYWGETAPDAQDTWHAVQGHVRERAGRRIERLCAEQGIPLRVNGNLDATPPMGPQRSGTFLEIVGSVMEVDGGVLYETRDDLGLTYRTNRSKYTEG